MRSGIESITVTAASAVALLPGATSREQTSVESVACFHCGAPCRPGVWRAEDHDFCCAGCATVFEILTANGLDDFYRLGQRAGVRGGAPVAESDYGFLDEPAVRERVVDFADARLTRVTFRVPAIHCMACVWLLENLFRLKPGVGASRVDFGRREVSIRFDPAKVRLSEVAHLLASLGYVPDLNLASLEERPPERAPRRLWLQIGVAGFAFGNTMLFSLAAYLGLDAGGGAEFRRLMGWTSWALAVPVITFCAADYWRSAWISLRHRLLNIDVPIALGLVALFAQSSFEVMTGRGEGYFDSLSGLLFFLLCGKWFQRRTFERLAFDRDYKSFFPLAATRRRPEAGRRSEERVAVSQLAVGDRLVVRHGELVVADARLVEGTALIDYSFVTGEAEPVEKAAGDHLYAGGRQTGGTIEIELVKPVSQSYLTSLWNQEAFRKKAQGAFDTLTNQYSQRFTRLVVAVALGAGVFWLGVRPVLALKAFTSVLIVACPCALALAAPFTLGTGLRVLGRRGIFLKNAETLEALARIDTVVFDKTGTLTDPGAVEFEGSVLSAAERRWVSALARHSTHPLASRIAEALAPDQPAEPVEAFRELAGGGLEGQVAGRHIALGSLAWLATRGVECPEDGAASGSTVAVVIDGRYRGSFRFASVLRPEVDRLIAELSGRFELAVLSGDNERDRPRLASVFGDECRLRFHQSPRDKLEFIRGRQRCGRRVMMVGDGLNDAGALQQSDVGVAVVRTAGAFSPASDMIMSVEQVAELGRVFCFARRVVRVVRTGFVISALYNVVGVGIAAAGQLAPVVCAVLMPLSSVTVVAFAVGATGWMARRTWRP
ncbi:MAG TPA: heavy metal translocating P-type ATPase metal-binding domain-containing protein [Methylomirabilota bacterium]|nr:heavy metal translocating P-type ATPase metal-binding domain-containing protein [Methylomirabilota bacterium]